MPVGKQAVKTNLTGHECPHEVPRDIDFDSFYLYSLTYFRSTVLDVYLCNKLL